MTDITNFNLDAALIDQSAAGSFKGKPYAFVPIIDERGWSLGVAVANERGYNPIDKQFRDQTEAKEFCDGLNEHIGLKPLQVCQIIVSTMGGRPYVAVQQ